LDLSKRRLEGHRYYKCRPNDRYDVPGARSISLAGQSSPFPHPRLLPMEYPAALDSNPFAPLHHEHREDPSMKKVVLEYTLRNVHFFIELLNYKQ